MQSVKRNGSRRKSRKAQYVGKYTSRLNMYEEPPTEDMTLEEFEQFAIDRLKLMKGVEEIGVKHPKKYGDIYRREVQEVMRKHMPLREQDGEDAQVERRKDHISHFILRLAYCRTSELRSWFLAQECALFTNRYQVANRAEGNDLLTKHTSYRPITEEEKIRLLPLLVASGFRLSPEAVRDTDYYKVPFEEAIDPLRKRSVFVQAGYSYIPRSSVVDIMKGQFRAKLSKALLESARALPHLNEDDRILPMLKSLESAYLGKSDYSSTKFSGTVKISQLDELSKISMPLCMRVEHEHLRKEHHIKHGGRMQYGLFLKGVGLSLEDALTFWRSEFTKKIGTDKFEKNYAYNIRHNYGKVGNRKDYTPYNCMKIIMQNAPGGGDCHGCPYRHWDKAHLRRKVLSYGVSTSAANEIIDLVGGHHYGLACSRFYEAQHSQLENLPNLENGQKPNPTIGGLEHPNQYFDESQKLINGGDSRGANKYLRGLGKPEALDDVAMEIEGA